MWWLFSFAVIGLTIFVIVLWWRERRFLRKKTSEVMSESLWQEIEQERVENLEKRRKFRQALDQATTRK